MWKGNVFASRWGDGIGNGSRFYFNFIFRRQLCQLQVILNLSSCCRLSFIFAIPIRPYSLVSSVSLVFTACATLRGVHKFRCACMSKSMCFVVEIIFHSNFWCAFLFFLRLVRFSLRLASFYKSNFVALFFFSANFFFFFFCFFLFVIRNECHNDNHFAWTANFVNFTCTQAHTGAHTFKFYIDIPRQYSFYYRWKRFSSLFFFISIFHIRVGSHISEIIVWNAHTHAHIHTHIRHMFKFFFIFLLSYVNNFQRKKPLKKKHISE